MSTLYHLGLHVKRHGLAKHKPLYLISIMLFFWTVFDGIISFISPLLLSESGLSNSSMGAVIGASSVAGAIFDLVLSKVIRKSNYRRLFLAMFVVSLVQISVLWRAQTIFIFLVAMVLWGLYYDLLNFATFDFVGRRIEENAHVSSFGVIDVFKSLGYFVAPVIIGISIQDRIGTKEFLLGGVFLLFSFIVFLFVLPSLRKSGPDLVKERSYQKRDIFSEARVWLKVVKAILPALIVILFMNIYYAFFWTIGPLYSEGFTSFHPLNGSFLAVFGFPPLLVGWIVGPVSRKIKDKRLPIFLFLSAFFLLTLLAFNTSPFLVLFLIFLSSLMVSFMWSNLAAFFSVLIERHPNYEKEIEGVEDFFTNLGFVIGPVFAGLLSDIFGYSSTFAFLGIAGSIAAFILLLGPYTRMLSKVKTGV